MFEPSGLWLRISPEPSRLYLHFLSAAHLLAVLGTLVSGVPLWTKIALVFAVIASWGYYRGRFRLEHTVKRPSIVYTEQAGWRYRIGEGDNVTAELMPTTVATRWIVILHFRSEQDGFRYFLIPKDSLQSHEFHALRMILKISGPGNRAIFR